MLGSEMRTAVLPARVICPLCTEDSLHVYKDQAVAGYWYWCPRCRFAGDAIELAAKAWKISPPAAVLKLAALGIPFPHGMDDQMIRGYVEDHIEYRRRVDGFWRETMACSLPLAGPLALFARRLSIPSVRPHDWPLRGGQFVGVTDRRKVLAFFQPAQDLNRRGENGSNRMFVGSGWDQLIAIVHHDLPGRIRGFLLIGREARNPEDYVYRRVLSLTGSPAGQDHGIAMLESVLQPHPDFGDQRFCCLDPAEALRLQLTHLAEHSQPLPLTGGWGNDASLAWSMLQWKPTVLFGAAVAPAEAARLFRHARHMQAAVATVPTVGQRPRDVLRAAGREAARWSVALEAQLAARPSYEAEEVLLQVGMDRVETGRFLGECHPDVRAKAGGILAPGTGPSTVSSGKRTVSEVDGTWRDVQTGTTVSDVIVRIDRIVHRKLSGRIMYEGTLRRRGEEAPFSVDQATIEAGAASWFRRFCPSVGLGSPLVASGWARRLFQIAQLFHEPVVVEAEGVLGWDDVRNAFVFPSFAIEMGGAVVEHESVPGETALNLPVPHGLDAAAVEAFSVRDDSIRLGWAATVAVAAAVTAPVFGLAPGSIAFHGYGDKHVTVPTARALGCPVIEVTKYLAATIEKIMRARESYRWPVVAAFGEGRRDADRVGMQLPEGVVCRVGTWTAEVLSLLGGWTLVEVPTPDASTLPTTTHGPSLLINYLVHFCRNRPQLGDDGLLAAILWDMAAWFAEQGGAAKTVHAAAPLLRAPEQGRFADRFAYLLTRMYDEGNIELCRTDKAGYPSQPVLAVLPGRELHVPRSGISRALARHGAPSLDPALVTRRLAASGVLLREEEHCDHPGWVVPEQWWYDRLTKYRKRDQEGLL
jgi:hypothetical protein